MATALMEVTVKGCCVPAALAVLVVLAVAGPAAAQDAPAGTVSMSYSALKDKELTEWFVAGWVASAGGALTRSIEVVGEVGGHYKTLTGPGLSELDAKLHLKMHSFLGGVRFGSHGKVGGFVQVLTGATVVSVGFTECGSGAAQLCDALSDVDTSRTYFTLQPGGGIDIAIARRAAIRLQGDYRAVFPRDNDDTLHQFRFATGVVLGFGTK